MRPRFTRSFSRSLGQRAPKATSQLPIMRLSPVDLMTHSHQMTHVFVFQSVRRYVCVWVNCGAPLYSWFLGIISMCARVRVYFLALQFYCTWPEDMRGFAGQLSTDLIISHLRCTAQEFVCVCLCVCVFTCSILDVCVCHLFLCMFLSKSVLI